MRCINKATLVFLLLVFIIPLNSFARWLSVDPKASKYPNVSPYTYCLDNPIKMVDPDGKDSYLYTWAPKGGQIGHSAMGTDIRDDQGNKTGKIQVRHLWPATGIDKKHTTAGADYLSETVDISNMDEFEGGEGRGADAIVKIEGGIGQDATVNAAFDQAATNPTYGGTTNNCSKYTGAGIQATGINPGNGAAIQIKIKGVTVDMANTSTPVSVNNAVVGSGDPRVTVIKGLPSNQQNPNIILYEK